MRIDYWKCKICGEIFSTRKHKYLFLVKIEKFKIMKRHLQKEHNIENPSIIKLIKSL